MRLNNHTADFYLTKDFTIPEIPPFDLNSLPDYTKDVYFPLSGNVEFELVATIDSPTLSNITGNDLGGVKSFTVQFSKPYQEQVRRHKKKRINKKWAKRYGYRTKTRIVRFENVELASNSPEEYEFVGRKPDFIF